METMTIRSKLFGAIASLAVLLALGCSVAIITNHIVSESTRRIETGSAPDMARAFDLLRHSTEVGGVTAALLSAGTPAELQSALDKAHSVEAALSSAVESFDGARVGSARIAELVAASNGLKQTIASLSGAVKRRIEAAGDRQAALEAALAAHRRQREALAAYASELGRSVRIETVPADAAPVVSGPVSQPKAKGARSGRPVAAAVPTPETADPTPVGLPPSDPQATVSLSAQQRQSIERLLADSDHLLSALLEASLATSPPMLAGARTRIGDMVAAMRAMPVPDAGLPAGSLALVEVAEAGLVAASRDRELKAMALVDNLGHRSRAISDFTSAVDDIAAVSREALMHSVSDASGAASRSATTLLVALIGGAIMVVCALLFVKATIVVRLTNVSRSVRALADGDLSVGASASGNDEIGSIAHSLETFRQNEIERRRLAVEAGQERERADRFRRDAEAAEAAFNRDRAQAIDAVVSGLAKLAAQDLTWRLDQDMPASFVELKTDFNVAARKLEHALMRVRDGAGAISHGAVEIAEAADDLSQRTEEQSASLEETSAALSEITTAVQRTAMAAARARDEVEDAKTDAHSGVAVLSRTMQTMQDIEASSNEIAKIVGVIDEIAFQTNLLALNAGVEAARAGDAGRGFAVVASEVRDLAQRCAQSARSIKGLIQSANGRVGDGVKLVTATGQSFDRIVAKVTRVDTTISEIAARAREQADSLDQVNKALADMDQNTQRNAAMVEQSTAAAHALNEEARELLSLVGEFRLDGVTIMQPAAESRRAALRRDLEAWAADVRAAG